MASRDDPPGDRTVIVTTKRQHRPADKPSAVSDDRTVFAPALKAVAAEPVPSQPEAPLQSAPQVTEELATPPAHVPPSKLPLIAFLMLAMLALGVSTMALVMHISTGGRQTSFTEAELEQNLVAVDTGTTGADAAGVDAAGAVMTPELEAEAEAEAELANLPDISQPNMINLSGDPLVVRRRFITSRQILKLQGDILKKAKPLKLTGDVFRLTDNLDAGGEVLSGAMTGSQIGFAFAQTTDTDFSEDTPTVDAAPVEDATVVAVNLDSQDEQVTPARTFFRKTIDGTASLSSILTAGGFAAEQSKDAEQVARDRFEIDGLAQGDGIAVIGFKATRDQFDYIPAQLAIYRKGVFQRALAITDIGTYAEAENPWFGQDIFREEDSGGSIAKQRLMDAIYGAAVRNNISTAVAGEIILMLSRSFDLEQPIRGDESITVVYSSKARDKKTGLGKILYVRVDRSSGDPMECYVFQPQPKAAFECVSGKGDGAQTGGMVTPVKGVITAKFGPAKDPVTKKRRLNTGVDWTAPPGSPVVAAFDGKVLFAGPEGKRGNTVKLGHDDGTVTVYTYLKSFADNLVEGKRLRAGQRLGVIGHSATSEEPLLHFELLRGNQPVNPFQEYQNRVETGGAIEALVFRITTIESANRCDAANPLSTAVGLGQFIQSTWLRIIADHRPDLMAGRSRAEILALRTNCDLALAMTTALTRENASYIRATGHAVTPGNLYLAHFLGPGGAAKALRSSPAQSVAEVMGANVVKANPFLTGKDVGWMIDWAARKMAGKGKAPPTGSGSGAAKAVVNSYAGNSAFNQFREIVAELLK